MYSLKKLELDQFIRKDATAIEEAVAALPPPKDPAAIIQFAKKTISREKVNYIAKYREYRKECKEKNKKSDSFSVWVEGFIQKNIDDLYRHHTWKMEYPKKSKKYIDMTMSQLETLYGLPEEALKHIMYKESKGEVGALNKKSGAAGPFGIRPYPHSEFKGNPFNPGEAAEYASQIIQQYESDFTKKVNMRDNKFPTLQYNMNKYGSFICAVAAYNWGKSNVLNKAIDNAKPETKDYINQFLKNNVDRKKRQT